MLKIYIAGIMVLLVAILANVLAAVFSFLSWYDFLSLLNKNGWAAFRQLRVTDVLWLFFIYPFLLGCGALAGFYLYGFLSKN